MPRKIYLKSVHAKRTNKKTNTKTKRMHTSKSNTTKQFKKLLNYISNNRSETSKSDLNLPARLIQNDKPISKITKPLIYSKLISSSYTTSMHNGDIHSAGKEVIDDSTKPYIQVSELHNNYLDQYMIPRNQLNKNINKQKIIKLKSKKKKYKPK